MVPLELMARLRIDTCALRCDMGPTRGVDCRRPTECRGVVVRHPGAGSNHNFPAHYLSHSARHNSDGSLLVPYMHVVFPAAAAKRSRFQLDLARHR